MEAHLQRKYFITGNLLWCFKRMPTSPQILYPSALSRAVFSTECGLDMVADSNEQAMVGGVADV